MLKDRSEYGSQKEYCKADGERRCKQCCGEQRGMWICVKCKGRKPRIDFSVWLSQRATKQKCKLARCNTCKDEEAAEERTIARESSSVVAKRPKQ